MKKSIKIASAAVLGTAMAVSLASPAYAWHPEGKIVKQVTNVTAGTAMSDANNSATAVAAKPGDTLKYTITISNPAAPEEKNLNDLAAIKLTDQLPQGVELVKDASMRTISESMSNLAPGKSVTKEITVKVTATKDMTIENKACFSGNSIVNDAPRNGCDSAFVKVTVPQTPVTPPVTPTTPTPAPQAPAQLPNTGAGSALVVAGAVAVAGYAANMLRLRFARNR
jgi:uncharacterized repeat protein (TIGR01451 family)